MSVFVAEELSDLLNTRVTIGRINIGLLNRIIIDDVLLDDQDEQEMLKVTRLSAKFDIMPFFKGKISISSVQLFGFNINLQKKTPDSPPNFKFVLDAFASNDTVKKNNSLDLRINSILIRRGRMAYHVLSEEETPGKFNAKHIHLQNIIANISLKALSKDSINLGIKRLSLDEKVSGFSLKKMSLKLVANSRQTSIDNFAIELPETSLKLDTIHLIYDSLKAFDRFTEQVRFSFRTLPSQITLKDISPFLPALSHFKEPISLDMEVKGTVNQLTCSHLEITADNRQFRLKGDVALQDLSHPQDAYVFGTLSELTATTRGVGFLVRNLSHDYNGVPPVLERLGNVSFRGEVSGYFTDIVTYGQLHTDLGGVNMDLKLSSDKSKGLFAYSGAVKTTDYKLGKLLANEQLGEITFNLDVHGRHVTDRLPVVELKGLIASVDYSRYRYENITLDGQKILLYANIGNIKDLAAVMQNDAGGIGLFRSEFIYLEQDHYPTEEEQFRIYKQAAETMAGKRVIIRTLDIGADKQCDYFEMEKEENPALGCRAIRICLTRPEIFKTQLRALFRASMFGNISIMYPMIISVTEVKQIKAIVAEVKKELTEQGIPFKDDVEQGVMIETPAAVMISDLLAKEVDFFSIGTNDLSQYTMAIDRQNPQLDLFFDPHHPAVLRMISLVMENAHKAGIWAGICGELGADQSLTKEFLAMGVDELSVSPGSILPLRKIILETNVTDYKAGKEC